MNMNNKIYIKQWLALKPYEKQVSSDSYYLQLSNILKKSLLSKDSAILSVYLDEPQVDLLACFLTSYFEDLISETHVWNTFTTIHFEQYGKILPFYTTERYDKDDINVQDLSFLIWYFLNTVQEEKFISPYHDFILGIAAQIAFILIDEYEYAPENNHLKTFYTLDENETDYYKVRKLIDNILFKTWLFSTDTAAELAKNEKEIIEELEDGKNMIHYLQETRDSTLHTSCTRLMSLKGKEWAAQLLGSGHRLSSQILQISQRIRGYFLYKGQNETDVFLEHIASGKNFSLTKKSFDYSSELNEPNLILFMGIVKWYGEWWFSGVLIQIPWDANLILAEKNSIKSRMQVNFIDHQANDMKALLTDQLNSFKLYNNGFPIAFMPLSAIKGFIESYLDFHTKTLNLSEEEIANAKKRAAKEGFFGKNENEVFEGHDSQETGLVFFNPESGIEIGFNLNNAFPLENNPYFNQTGSEEDFMNLLMSEQISKELVNFCIENCRDHLPFLKKGSGKLFLNDLDFLMRFWKMNNYHSRPEITFTGHSA